MPTDQPLFELRSGETWRNPWADYQRLRDDAPVHLVERAEHPDYWVLSRFADVFEAARDPATFSSAQGLTPDAGAMDMFAGEAAPIVMMDPPDHTAMRRLISRQLTPRRVSAIAGDVEAFVDERLDRVAHGGESDIVAEVFKPLPSYVVAHYLGVPVDDRRRFDAWTEAIVAANAAGDIGNATDAALELFGFANELIERRKVEPGDDLVSDLVAVGEDIASPMWIVGFVFTMVTGGNDTVTGLLGGAAELLCQYPEQRGHLIAAPETIAPAIDELLRLTSPVQNLARTTTRSVEIHDRTIPAGAKVMLLYGAANHDEREFGPDADALDVQRDVGRMLAFGSGAHHCIGASAARLQAAVAIRRLLERFPDFDVDAAAGRFAPGAFVRRYASLPFTTG